MKRKRFWTRIGICALALLIACGFGSWVYFQHGDWLFSLETAWNRSHFSEKVDWLPLLYTGETEKWDLDALSAHGHVTFSEALMLINSSHPLPDTFEPLLEDYNGARMHPQMIASYIALRDTVEAKTGIRIYVSADFRTAEEQEEILKNSPPGIAAEVGCSEHEAGLALDVYAPYYAGENFLKSAAGREVNRICAEFGFVLRYPKGKETLTGISYEPWHLRYVGEPHAQLLADSGLVLEEYIEAMEIGTWYRTDGYLIGRCRADELYFPVGWVSCVISPDNCGNYIVTLTMN